MTDKQKVNYYQNLVFVKYTTILHEYDSDPESLLPKSIGLLGQFRFQ
jgi:hypothetical protein